MGIRFVCPNGHKLNVKEELAGKRAICPSCGVRVTIPTATQAPPSEGDSPAAEGSLGAKLLLPSTALPAAPGDAVAENEHDGNRAPAVVEPAGPRPLASPAPVGEVGEAPPPVTDGPTDTGPVHQYMSHRRRRRQTQMTVAIVLLLAVVVLAIILVWVLQRGPDATALRRGQGGVTAILLWEQNRAIAGHCLHQRWNQNSQVPA